MPFLLVGSSRTRIGADSEPAVATANAARSIYMRELGGRGRGIESGSVVVKDEGDHWAVYQPAKQIPPPQDNADGTQTITVVAGGLELYIDKCTGSTRAHYAR